MKFLMGMLVWNVWAAAPLPAPGDAVVGKMYAYTTAYPGNSLACPGGECEFPFRGKLPASASSLPVSPRTGGLRCPTCQIGIYLFDDYHYVFVYN